ncbi:MAG: hypothetical protein ACYCUM_01875, partial [Solirubrobacteraceae bacterium]
RSEMPSFVARPAPLASAVDAIERGIERRAARLWAPRWVGAALMLRTLVQPLTERAALADQQRLAAAIEAADDGVETAAHDPLLGVAVPADTGERA